MFLFLKIVYFNFTWVLFKCDQLVSSETMENLTEFQLTPFLVRKTTLSSTSMIRLSFKGIFFLSFSFYKMHQYLVWSQDRFLSFSFFKMHQYLIWSQDRFLSFSFFKMHQYLLWSQDRFLSFSFFKMHQYLVPFSNPCKYYIPPIFINVLVTPRNSTKEFINNYD